MGEKKRILVLVAIMTVVATVIGGVAIGVLYDTAFMVKRLDLAESAQSQARLMEAVARFDKRYSSNFPQGSTAATISQLEDAHNNYQGFGETGEFTLARRQGDKIVFLLSHRYYDLDKPKPVPFDSEWAEPMRRALSGRSGTVIGLDYRGVMVLAAHEPVAELDLGIVAKVDLTEIRLPFIVAGGIVVGVALLVIAVGATIFFRVSNPIIREMEIARERAEASSRAKSEFLATMSHELRTPLNAIIGFSDAIMNELQGPLGNEKYREYIQDIQASGNHLLGLINDILDVSAIEVGKIELQEMAIDVAETVERSVRLVEPRADNRNLHIAVSIQDGLPMLYADSRRLHEILLNLLSNATKFSYDGGKITLDVRIDDGGSIGFTVSDTGVGMDVKELAKAMEPFGQVDNMLSREFEGTGLGLPLSKAMTELHGGTFNIESEKGRGTTIRVRFPPERSVLAS